MQQKSLVIAMLEDDSDDRYLTEETVNAGDFNLSIQFFSDSNELLTSLEKINPQLILVDYNSTPENGITVLKKLKNMKAYKAIPVVILSNCLDSKYSKECYAEGAAGFVNKPRSLHETKQKINSFFTYWTQVVEV